jgi:hypothetical protein
MRQTPTGDWMLGMIRGFVEWGYRAVPAHICVKACLERDSHGHDTATTWLSAGHVL